MNIKEAKNEIKNSIRAYLSKDEEGDYEISCESRRPILLIGASGIGKTAIMEQISKEMGINLVSYTMTHHTKQSAVGLPFIEKKIYGGKEYSVTEYTMSEIIASVYEKTERTGIEETILFIDEINCVSETLAPCMLQFLQNKTFGTFKIPDSTIIVAAGNPPQYNKSVREFDIATLDRVRKIIVDEDVDAWLEYACRTGVHGSIISYLSLKRNNFYKTETTPDGKFFVTARGWTDLSKIMYVYEKENIPITENVIIQYIQHSKTARDFFLYLELYNKYRNEYDIDDILEGKDISLKPETPFDERIGILSLIHQGLHTLFLENHMYDEFVSGIYEVINEARESDMIRKKAEILQKELDNMIRAEIIEKQDIKIKRKIIKKLLEYSARNFEEIKSDFYAEADRFNEFSEEISKKLNNAFNFIEKNFGQSQEAIIFITDLNIDYYATKFISRNDCPMYYKYNSELLFDDKRREIMEEIADISYDLG